MTVYTKALLCLLLAAAIPLGCQGQAREVYAPPPGVDVRHYDLTLTLDPATRRIDAAVRFSVRHPDTLAALPLAFDGLTVESVTVDGRRVAVHRGPNRLIVPLRDGDTASVVEMAYAGVPETGLYAGTHEGVRFVYTDSWPVRGRGWLPAVHHPSDPATLALTLTVPDAPGMEAVGTGELVAVDTLGTSVRYRWVLEAAAPTYTYAFAVSDFAETCTASPPLVAGDKVPVCSFLPPPDSARAERLLRTPEMIEYFSELLGPYDFDRYAAVAVPISFGGMENATIAFLRASLFDTDEVEAVQAHEAAHQWFGDRVVIAGWRDLWLSEGSATYLTTLFYEHVDGPDRARREWVAMAAAGAEGVLVPEGPVDPNEHLTGTVYNKGGSVLHLLRLTLGQEAFFRALRTTYARYAGRPLSTEDFKAILEEVGGRDLTALFDYWVYDERVPVLHTTWDAGARTLRWQIEGDAGTLRGDVPFELQVRQGDTVRYVNVQAREVTLQGTTPPTVRPVGIMMEVVGR